LNQTSLKGKTMTNFAYLLRNATPGAICPPLDNNGPLGQFRAWERGFDAYVSGRGMEANTEHGGAAPLWRDGWHAAKRIEQLRKEQPNNTSNL